MFCWQILSYGSEFCCIVNMTIQFLFLNFLSQNIERNRRKEKRKSFWLYQHGPLLLNMKYITVKYGGGFYILCSMTLSYKHAAVYWYTTWQTKVGNSSSFSIMKFLWRKWNTANTIQWMSVIICCHYDLVSFLISRWNEGDSRINFKKKT